MDDKIILIIENEAPLGSDSLGELFTAFARDYSKLTHGHSLVVTRLEQGSTLIEWTDLILTTAGQYLKEAAGTAKAIKSLSDFAVLLKSLLGKKKAEKPARRITRRRKKTGDRSAEAIAKIAAENRCRVRFKRITTQGETLEFELSPADALEFQGQVRDEREASRQVKGLQFPAIDIHGNSEALPAVRASIRRLQQAGDGTISSSEIDQIAEALVSILEAAGLSELVEQIASGFEAQGLLQVASALRRSSGKHEPPLTTT